MDAETSTTVVRLRSMQAVQQTTAEDAPKKQGERTDLLNLSRSPQAERATQNDISRSQQHRLDRLARDFPDLHEEVKAGHLSVHRASLQAGFIREVPVLDRLRSLWGKASPAEQDAFLAWITEEGRK